MTELIKITRHNGKKTVCARELHHFLENGDHFSTWIKDRIKQYGFIENQDFVTYSENSEKGRPTIQYALTLDMGKELGMVERNEKGREIRKYFIEVEKNAQPDFTPIANLYDHGKIEVQKLNSKEVNTYNYEKGGTKDIIKYNIKNCLLHTGKTPAEIKKMFENSNFTVAIKNNAKELIRKTDPITACAMSLTDNMVKLGGNHEKAADVSNKHGREIFKFMFENKMIPGELKM